MNRLIPIFRVLVALLWLDLVVLIICGVVSLVLTSVEPYAHFVIERDPSLSYPYITEETFPMWLLGLLVIGVPLAVLIAYALVGYGPEPTFRLKRLLGTDVVPKNMARWVVLLAWVMTMLLNLMFTNSVKVYGGRPRPNFFAMCNYQGYRTALDTGDFSHYNSMTTAGAIGHLSKCLGTSKQLKEAMSSFPSGHASSAFAGLGFLAWFFYGLYRPHPRRAEQIVDIDVLPRVNGCPRPHSQVLYAVLAFASVVCAFFIAVSRTRDYWHNYSDILTGAIVGIASVFVSVNLYSLDFLTTAVYSATSSGSQSPNWEDASYVRQRTPAESRLTV